MKRATEIAQRRKNFLHALAVFLSGDSARKSIDLEMGKPYAKEWAALRNATPIFGYLTVEETELQLTEFIGWR
jgi:hypothetical protein